MKFFLAFASLSFLLLLGPVREVAASMDWTDLCAPDAVALSQAVKDFPSDRFEQSPCIDSVFKRGTCQVQAKAEPGREETQMNFVVQLRNNEGTYRNYEILMGLDPSSHRAGGACRLQKILRRSVGSASR